MTVTLGAKDTIEKLKSGQSYIDAFNDLTNWLAEYKQMAKIIHPDVCHEPGAKDALTKLNQWKEELEKGKIHYDDAGIVTYKILNSNIEGNLPVLQQSLNNFNKLKSFKEKIDIDFQRYIPNKALLTPNNDKSKLDLSLTNRCIPISSIGTLPQVHVNWILSRMLEFIGYIHKKGYVHAGINPDSVYVEPKNHGINVISFYHMAEVNKKLSTASGKWIYMYPDHIKTKKIATADIDIELCKRTAVWLLGDKSGIGTCLRKTHNTAFLDFINKKHDDPIEAFFDYRKMLENNFERKFINLNI
jgi:serine/threonine protein kinase